MANTKHHISHANQIYVGGVKDSQLNNDNSRLGVPLGVRTTFQLIDDTPGVADVDLIIDAATSTELPNAATITYTTADDGTSPFDNAPTPAPASVVMADGSTYSVWTLDAPRALSCLTAHSSSIVAMTVTVHGFDVYKQKMSETITIAATGTSETDAGLKAFKYIHSIDITSAGNAESNTLDLGTTDELGLPFRATIKENVEGFFNGLPEASVVTVADDTTATAATGDVRGTVNPAGTLDGAKRFGVYQTVDPDDRDSALGIAQYYDPDGFTAV